MKELIPIVEKDGIPTISARDLHSFLEAKKDFSDWIKARVEKYGFIEGEDFTTIQGKSTGGRPSIEYFLSIDMAKQLTMVEDNKQGKEARRYFIAMEKKAKSGYFMRKKSAGIRNHFTEILKIHGCNKPGHFIQITMSMKDLLGLKEKKKSEYDRKELAKTMLAEDLAIYRMVENESGGYRECKDESVEATAQIAGLIGNQRRLA
jgi:phage anti-repressor protein